MSTEMRGTNTTPYMDPPLVTVSVWVTLISSWQWRPTTPPTATK